MLHNADVWLVAVARQYIVGVATLEEVYVNQLVLLVVDALVRGGDSRLEERADPRDEFGLSALQEVNVLVNFAVDMNGQRRSQIERQVLDEI